MSMGVLQLTMGFFWFRKLSVDFRHSWVFIFLHRRYSKTRKSRENSGWRLFKGVNIFYVIWGPFNSFFVQRNLTQLSSYCSKLQVKNRNATLKAVLLWSKNCTGATNWLLSISFLVIVNVSNGYFLLYKVYYWFPAFPSFRFLP